MTTRVRCRWIAFDAVGTLIHPVHAAGEVYHQVAQKYGSRLSADEVARRFRRAFYETEQGDLALPDATRLATSEDREISRWRGIVRAVLDDVAEIESCFNELFTHFGKPTSWRCFDEVPDVLDRLVARGCHIAMASNFDRRLHSVCNGLAALKPIEVRAISSEVGCRKPGRKFFEALLARAGCIPQEMLMVGDDLGNDVEGARHAGLQAVFLNRRTPPQPGELGSLRELDRILER